MEVRLVYLQYNIYQMHLSRSCEWDIMSHCMPLLLMMSGHKKTDKDVNLNSGVFDHVGARLCTKIIEK